VIGGVCVVTDDMVAVVQHRHWEHSNTPRFVRGTTPPLPAHRDCRTTTHPDNPSVEGSTVAEPFPRQPTDVWVLTAVKTIRNGLGEDSLISVDEANAWLNALKSATLEALHALDRINTVIVEVTSGVEARNTLPERHGLAAVEKWSDGH
jgi:hypothetical protein